MFLKLLVTKLNDKINFRREVGKNTTVSRLLNDRPEIAEVLNGHGLLKQWLVEQFSGKVTKFPIQWDPKEPEDGDIAEHCHPQRNEPAKVRVSRNMSGLDQLSGVVFELFNIQYHKGHSRLWEKACSGKIGEQEYSHRSYRLEYKALCLKLGIELLYTWFKISLFQLETEITYSGLQESFVLVFRPLRFRHNDTLHNNNN